MDSRPVGIFDSGFGGLTIVQAIADLLPNEALVYVGDTERYPYGSKPLDQVGLYSHDIASWLVAEHDVKMIVVACNTASAAALGQLQERFDVPVIGVIDHGVQSVLKVSASRNVGVIGTVGTISSGAYQTAVAGADPSVRLVCAACPGFVEFVERGELDSDQVRVLAQRLLSPIVDAKVDALLLGCTHYPFLARAISEVVGREVVLVSSAEETAFGVGQMMIEADMLREGPTIAPKFLSSGNTAEFERIGSMLLGIDIGSVEQWTSPAGHSGR